MDSVKIQNGTEKPIKLTLMTRWFTRQLFSVANVLKVITLLALCLFIYN